MNLAERLAGRAAVDARALARERTVAPPRAALVFLVAIWQLLTVVKR